MSKEERLAKVWERRYETLLSYESLDDGLKVKAGYDPSKLTKILKEYDLTVEDFKEYKRKMKEAVRINNLRKMTMNDVVPVDDLQNLLVPKQEITEEQVMDWLDKNDFYDHITAETVLERAVDKGELRYYGTKYSVIETPTIPKYVAEFLELVRSDVSLMLILEVASTRRERSKWEKEYDWISENDEVFARAWLDGYEVEEEQKYYVLDTEDIPMLVRTYGVVNRANTHLSIHEKGRNTEHYELTEQEIKDYDHRYMVFAEPVVEEMEE